MAATIADFPDLTIHSLDTVVVDPVKRDESWGCGHVVTGSRSSFAQSGTPDQRVREQLAALGWTEDWAYGADGVDGTAYALRLGTVICHVRGAWDGGDITDPSNVPEDWYRMSVGCTDASSSGPPDPP